MSLTIRVICKIEGMWLNGSGHITIMNCIREAVVKQWRKYQENHEAWIDKRSSAELSTGNTADFAPSYIGWRVMVPCLMVTFIATAIVALRIGVRMRMVKKLGMDDIFIGIALLQSWVLTLCVLSEFSLRPAPGDFITPYDEFSIHIRIAQLVLAANSLWVVATNITKASCLLQYIRILRPASACTPRRMESASPSHRAWLSAGLHKYLLYLSYTLLWVCIFPANLYGVLRGILMCSPVDKIWDPTTPGTCGNSVTYWRAVAGMDILLDFAVVMIPLPMIWRLRLELREKLAIGALWAMGIGVCILGIVRLVVVQVDYANGDFAASGTAAVLWSSLEANVGIICASLLALRPLITKYTRSTRRSRAEDRLPAQAGARPDTDPACPGSDASSLTTLTVSSPCAAKPCDSATSADWPLKTTTTSSTERQDVAPGTMTLTSKKDNP